MCWSWLRVKIRWIMPHPTPVRVLNMLIYKLYKNTLALLTEIGKRNSTILVLALLLLVCMEGKVYATNNHLYATGPLKEIDRCGSAWLIKRHVDQNATFRFYAEGAIITAGIPFDTPDAQMRRTHRFSTFEAIMAKYKLNDDRLQTLAKIIHDIEVNAWEKRKEYRKILHDISKITDKTKTDEQRLNDCLGYFDDFHSN